ncbi:MAG: hypothetical protein DHS20C12_28240 [Pseudohongiella sp.]|nr:MAG: hypothetical protein DHS20C12_28240 [Pseudohongiella sp.]
MMEESRLSTTVQKILGLLAINILFASSASSEPSNHVIEIKGFAYSPASLVVKPGDSVTWVNKDIVSHTSTEVENDTGSAAASTTWTTDEISAGNEVSLTIVPTMGQEYFCKYHPAMKASLIIE